MTTSIEYNGIVFDTVRSDPWEVEAVYDGPTYLYTRTVISCTGVLNPEAMSFERNAAGVVNRGGGLYGAATRLNIEHALMQPRKKLVVSVGTVTTLSSPLPGFTVDAFNGPKPLYVNVLETDGDKTMIIQFIVETCLNRCPGAAPPIVLSHRWVANDEIVMPHYLTTRTIHGHAILRTDRMLSAGVIPDDFRAAFFHPVPGDLQRSDINVTVTEDGEAVEYDVMDQERLVNISANGKVISGTLVNGITDIDVTTNNETVQQGLESVISSTIGGIIGGAVGGVAINSGRSKPKLFGKRIGLGTGAVVGGAIGFGSGILNYVLPKGVASCSATVTGDRNSRLNVLKNVAVACCVRTMPRNKFADIFFSVTAHRTGREVTAMMRASFSIPVGFRFTGTLPDNEQGLANFALLLPLPPEGVLDIATTSPTINPSPGVSLPGFGQLTGTPSRGVFIGRLVAQVLQSECAVVTAPVLGTARNIGVL